jgi:DNA-binding winged helix-turn-helix (wHTH) protein/TolB-like protein/Flp pilus assembly protein TadD
MRAQSVSAEKRGRSRLRIGEWSADPETNEIRRGGEIVRLEPKAMDVLMLLADRVGRVVTREELFAAVWPGVVVGDEALTQSIIKLRKALGDNSRSPSYIETISKRGYRLIAPVGSSEGAVALPVRRRPHAVWAAVAIAGLVLALGAAGALFFGASDAIEAGDDRQSAWITVTVAPFESLASDPEQAYFARGISENLSTDLSRHPGLRVIRETGTSTARPAAAAARYRISGSVQRDAGVLRITIHLVDTRTSEQLWSERFERPLGDLFAVQDEMIRRLVEFLPGKLSDADRQRIAKRYTRSLEAYDQFLRGQALFLVRRSEANAEARALYRKAIELDPNFARAYAGLAMTHAIDARLRDSIDAAPALERAFDLAETARLIDPEIPEVHWAIGFVHAQGRRHEQAIASLQRAIELDRSFADAYALQGGVHTYLGDPAKAIPLLRTAMRLNPDGGYLYFLVLGRAYLFEDDIEQALINLRAALLRNPVDVETRVLLAASLMAAGDHAAARWEADEIRSLQPEFSIRAWLETYPMTSPRLRQRLVALFARLES